jgi:transposase
VARWLCPQTRIMDTIGVGTDAGTRPAARGKRGNYRTHSLEDKRRIVEESLAGGASVSRVARRHDLNTNQLFTWRKRYVEGRLGPVGVANAPRLLAVRVGEAEPTERKAPLATTAAPEAEGGWIEIECVGRYRVRLHGAVDRVALAAVLEVLSGQ